jgi:hypothetical protein
MGQAWSRLRPRHVRQGQAGLSRWPPRRAGCGEQRHRPRQKQQTDRADRRGVENGHRRECQQGRSESGAPTWRHATAAAMTATTQATDPTRNSSPDAHPGEGRDRPVQVPHDHREDGSGQTDELQRAEVDGHPGVRLLTKTPEDVVGVWSRMEQGRHRPGQGHKGAQAIHVAASPAPARASPATAAVVSVPLPVAGRNGVYRAGSTRIHQLGALAGLEPATYGSEVDP